MSSNRNNASAEQIQQYRPTSCDRERSLNTRRWFHLRCSTFHSNSKFPPSTIVVIGNTINEVMFYLKWLFTQGPMDCSVTTQVRFEWVLTGSAKLSHCLNFKPDLRFGACIGLNLGL